MIRLHEQKYKYQEEINPGIVKQMLMVQSSSKTVLDVGCGFGALSEAIGKKGYTVWGIEIDKAACQIAQKRLDRVLLTDLADIEAVGSAIGDMKFDYLVFSDVLEHLYDPYTILKAYLAFLKKDGKVLISVPNAVVWTNRLAFLFGRFEYADTGVMDRTHVRFFTFRTAKQLVAAAGCEIVKTDYTPFLARAVLPVVKKLLTKNGPGNANKQQIIDSGFYKWYMKWFYPVEYFVGCWWKSMFAFRIIIIGKKL